MQSGSNTEAYNNVIEYVTKFDETLRNNGWDTYLDSNELTRKQRSTLFIQGNIRPESFQKHIANMHAVSKELQQSQVALVNKLQEIAQKAEIVNFWREDPRPRLNQMNQDAIAIAKSATIVGRMQAKATMDESRMFSNASNVKEHIECTTVRKSRRKRRLISSTKLTRLAKL